MLGCFGRIKEWILFHYHVKHVIDVPCFLGCPGRKIGFHSYLETFVKELMIQKSKCGPSVTGIKDKASLYEIKRNIVNFRKILG